MLPLRIAVPLSAGYYAVGASLVTWTCSNLPQYTLYQTDSDMQTCVKHNNCKWTSDGTTSGLILGLQLWAAQVRWEDLSQPPGVWTLYIWHGGLVSIGT